MEDTNKNGETNLIRKFILEHPELNSADNNGIASTISKQAEEEAKDVIIELSKKENSAVTLAVMEDDVDLSQVDNRSDLERIIAAGISIAKERDVLPDTIKDKVGTSEEIASVAFDAATVMEVIRKTANGEFSSFVQVKDYLIDIITVKVVSVTRSLVNKGMDITKALAVDATSVFLGEHVGAFVEYVLEYVAPMMEIKIKGTLTKWVQICSSKLKSWSTNLLQKKKIKTENMVLASNKR